MQHVRLVKKAQQGFTLIEPGGHCDSGLSGLCDPRQVVRQHIQLGCLENRHLTMP